MGQSKTSFARQTPLTVTKSIYAKGGKKKMKKEQTITTLVPVHVNKLITVSGVLPLEMKEVGHGCEPLDHVKRMAMEKTMTIQRNLIKI